MVARRWVWVVVSVCAVVMSANGAPGSTLGAGEKLAPGESITSGNGYLTMQPDGVLAVCAAIDPSGSCTTPLLWSAVVPGDDGPTPASFGLMAEYGCLEVRSPNNTRLWWTHTMAPSGEFNPHR